MAPPFNTPDVADALIVAAMMILGGVILAVCAATLYRRFAALSGPPHPRRRA
jgi:hypothetical protein